MGAQDLEAIKRRYAWARRLDRLMGRRHDLANDALVVVLEWGPALRLPEDWRLAQRQPGVTDDSLSQALAAAHEVTAAAYELTAPAWPLHRREDADEVDREAAHARQVLADRYPHLNAKSLAWAVSQANYVHAK